MKKQALSILFALFVIASCQKDNSTNPAVSSIKKIDAVVFKTADNPSLSTDVVATLHNDTIKAVFSQDVSLSSLVPTISFAGASISPANRTAQNFSGPVSYTVTAENGSTKRFVFALSNDPLNLDSATTLAQRWRYAKDSTTNVGNYYFIENGQNFPLPGVYIGGNNDYWEFRRDSSLTIHLVVNQHYETEYYFRPNNKLEVTGLMVHGMATIVKLTPTETILAWNNTSPNGGVYSKHVWLRR